MKNFRLLGILVLMGIATMAFAQTYPVDFQCNMSVQMKKGLFAPGDSLFVSGSFNGWGTADLLTDANNDSIYTLNISPDTAGETINFKFRFKHVATETWENDPNRSYLLPSESSVYYAWFNNDSIFIDQYDIDVTFSCNMELERLSGRFDPAEDTVSVNGDFNGWSAKTSILLPNPLNPDLYEGTFTIRRGVGETINFKFWYEDNNWESVDNRIYTFTQDDINALAAEFSASFNNGTLDNVINQSCDITFTVYTTGARSIIDGNPFPSVLTCGIAGSALPLQWPGGGWPDADSIRMIKLYDDGTNGDATASDGIFSGVVTFPAYTPLNVLYKYGINYGDAVNNGGGNDNEAGFGQNHELPMTKYMVSATTVDTFGTMGVSTLTDISLVPPEVEFQCNMSVQMKKGLFTPGDTLYVRGSFNGWGTTDQLSDANNDSIYTITLSPGNAGETINFKYMYLHSGDIWENDPNRQYVLPAGPSTYYAWFNNDSIYVEQFDIEFTFSCNMELERLSGRFDPAEDTVSVNGDFNGWATKTTILDANPLNPDLYEGTVTITRGLGETIAFKFWYEENNWESVDNRVYAITQDDINALAASYSAAFNNGTLDNVINQACDITFTVNTNGAKSAISGNPFPVLNTIHIAGSALPLQWPNGGWPDADSVRMIKLFDDGTNGDAAAGDGIFSGIVTFPAYTPLSVQYKYGANWGDAVNNEGGNDNEAGFAQNHTLHMTKYMTQGTTYDKFGKMGASMMGQTQILQAGWNMISLPYEVDDYAKTTLYPDAISPAYYYDGVYQEADSLKNGVGYWLKSSAVDTIEMIGGEISSIDIPVVAGWNMIGSVAQPVDVSDITSNPPGMITSEFFGYTTAYAPVDVLVPGKGYWVKTNGTGTLTLSSSLAGALAKQTIRIVPNDEMPPAAPEDMNPTVSGVPVEFAIGKAFPNPFNPVTRFSVSIPEVAKVQIAVYNVLGQKVKTLMNGEIASGSYDLEWDGTDGQGVSVPTGIYLIRMSADDFKASQKVILIK